MPATESKFHIQFSRNQKIQLGKEFVKVVYIPSHLIVQVLILPLSAVSSSELVSEQDTSCLQNLSSFYYMKYQSIIGIFGFLYEVLWSISLHGFKGHTQ